MIAVRRNMFVAGARVSLAHLLQPVSAIGVEAKGVHAPLSTNASY